MINSLDNFIKETKAHWTGLNTETITKVRQLLIDLTKASAEEAWLKEIVSQRPAAKELYRDPDYGFILLAHAEHYGMYRSPHNHGAGWVFYAVRSGEMEMATYKQITTAKGTTHLVSRGTELMKAGDCKVFLPGDIHDTRCQSDDFIQYRLTSSDFKQEIKSGRMIRFVGEP